MIALSNELKKCIEAIDATFERIAKTFEESRRDHERFLIELAEAQRRFEEIKRGKSE